MGPILELPQKLKWRSVTLKGAPLPSPLLLARSPEYPQRIRVASVFEPFVCFLLDYLSANFLIFLLLTSSFIVLSPLLARSPKYPQRIRVASVFEPFVYWPAPPSIHRYRPM